MRLLMLGTGEALVTKCYNTCFAFQNNGEYFLSRLEVDYIQTHNVRMTYDYLINNQ